MLTRHHPPPQEVIPAPPAPNTALALHGEVDFSRVWGCWNRAMMGSVAAENTNIPKSILQAPRLPPAPCPEGPWSISRPGCPRHPRVPQQTGADETRGSAGTSQSAECEGAPSHHAVAKEETQTKPSQEGGKWIRVEGPGLQCDSDTCPQRLGRDWWHLIVGGEASPSPAWGKVNWKSPFRHHLGFSFHTANWSIIHLLWQSPALDVKLCWGLTTCPPHPQQDREGRD